MIAEPIAQTALSVLRDKATRLRIDSVRSTTQAGSGHPTSCASAAEIMSVLFYSVMRYDPRDPHNRAADIFVLSKGHAAPVLYAAWAEAGAFPRERLLTLRQAGSEFEGHPTPRLPFVDVATGSLGQGLSVAVGMALNAKLDRAPQRVYVLMGDGESAEGSVWEAAQWASLHNLDNLCATIDINRLGQSQPTMLQHHMEIYRQRWEAFGWQALIVDGHNIPELLAAYETARQTAGRPTVVLARTIKGKGLDALEDKDGWHGKALPKDLADKVIAELERQLTGADADWRPNPLPAGPARPSAGVHPEPPYVDAAHPAAARQESGETDAAHPAESAHPEPPAAGPEPPPPIPDPPYSPGQKPVATRKAFAEGLAALGPSDTRIVVLDGDVKNSTHTEDFEKAAPDRFLEGYIAEQNILGMAMGLAGRGKIAFASTFACFFTRAYDFIRVAAISRLNIKLAGTHVGVSIGEDGPTQMGLEDIAMIGAEPNFTILYPADATAAWKCARLLAESEGPGYVRLGRGNSPVLYPANESFALGKCKVLRASDRDRALVVAGGVTVFEALAAYDDLQKQGIPIRVIDLFSIRPIDRETLAAAARACGGNVITVEDHYAHGGLGDAVLAALSEERIALRKLAIRDIPHSGKPEELLDEFGISARHIVEAVTASLRPSQPR